MNNNSRNSLNNGFEKFKEGLMKKIPGFDILIMLSSSVTALDLDTNMKIRRGEISELDRPELLSNYGTALATFLQLLMKKLEIDNKHFKELTSVIFNLGVEDANKVEAIKGTETSIKKSKTKAKTKKGGKK